MSQDQNVAIIFICPDRSAIIELLSLPDKDLCNRVTIEQGRIKPGLDIFLFRPIWIIDQIGGAPHKVIFLCCADCVIGNQSCTRRNLRSTPIDLPPEIARCIGYLNSFLTVSKMSEGGNQHEAGKDYLASQ